MRTLIDLPEEQVRGLDKLASDDGVSRAELVRRAIAKYLGEREHARDASAFGLLKDREIDGLALQRRLREDR